MVKFKSSLFCIHCVAFSSLFFPFSFYFCPLRCIDNYRVNDTSNRCNLVTYSVCALIFSVTSICTWGSLRCTVSRAAWPQQMSSLTRTQPTPPAPRRAITPDLQA